MLDNERKDAQVKAYQLICIMIESLKEDIRMEQFRQWIQVTGSISEHAKSLFSEAERAECYKTGMVVIRLETQNKLDRSEIQEKTALIKAIPEMAEYDCTVLYTKEPVPEDQAESVTNRAMLQFEHTRLGKNKAYPILEKEIGRVNSNREIINERMRMVVDYLEAGNFDAARIFFSQMHAAYQYGNSGIHPREFYIMIITALLVQYGKYSDDEVSFLVTHMQNTIIGETWYRFVLMELYEVCRRSLRSQINRFDTFEQKVHRFIDFEVTNPKLDLKTAADFFNLTPNYFSQQFKQHMGINFLAYVEEHRMNIGFELLRQRDMNVEKVALACGYDNVSSFRRNFKKHFGVNPVEVKG